MSERFLDDDVLAHHRRCRRHLYHDVAAALPDRRRPHPPAAPTTSSRTGVWTTIADLWLAADHYKWRAMRLAGVAEELITGDVDPWDRFQAWAATMPRLVRNPLYVWTHLELRRVFGIDRCSTPGTAQGDLGGGEPAAAVLSARRLLAHFRVELVATTDDPSDGLEAHRRLATDSNRRARWCRRSVPTRRTALLADPAAWNAWVDRLGDAEGSAITDLESMLAASRARTRAFAALGCRAQTMASHSCPTVRAIRRSPTTSSARARDGRAATDDERELVLLEVVALAARLAFADDSVLQLHLGPLRNVSPRLMDRVGRDAGADVIGDDRQAPGLVRFLGDLERAGTLPRTVLYNVNPADNALFAALAGAFAGSGVAGLVQWGPAWWFNDTIDGIRRQLDDLGSDRPDRRVHRHAHRLALDAVDDPARAVPADLLRRARTRRRGRADPRRSGDARGARPRRVRRERRAFFGFPRAVSDAAPILAVGGREHRLSDLDVESHLRDLFDDAVFDGETGRRILLVPPDHTRLHSGAGRITGFLFQHLTATGCDVWVIPALGTHVAMTAAELSSMFSDRVPADRVLEHRWTDGMVHLGEIDGHPGRGRPCPRAAVGSRRVDRAGRAARGDRHGELHEEPRHRPRRGRRRSTAPTFSARSAASRRDRSRRDPGARGRRRGLRPLRRRPCAGSCGS